MIEGDKFDWGAFSKAQAEYEEHVNSPNVPVQLQNPRRSNPNWQQEVPEIEVTFKDSKHFSIEVDKLLLSAAEVESLRTGMAKTGGSKINPLKMIVQDIAKRLYQKSNKYPSYVHVCNELRRKGNNDNKIGSIVEDVGTDFISLADGSETAITDCGFLQRIFGSLPSGCDSCPDPNTRDGRQNEYG